MAKPFTGDILTLAPYREIFDFAVKGYLQHLPPAVADVTRTLQRGPSTIHFQLAKLANAGYVSLVGEKGKRVVLTEKGIARADLKPRPAESSPSVLVSSGHLFPAPIHSAPCGVPTYGSGEVEQVCMAHFFPGWKNGDRLIIAVGNSMVAPDGSLNEESIFDSDLVWTRDDQAPGQGERVYAEYQTTSGEHECTIKKYYFNGWTGMVTLHPLNPQFADVVRPSNEVQVHSVVLGVRRLIGGRK